MGNKLKIDERKTLTIYSINKNSEKSRFLHTHFTTHISHSLPYYIPLDFLQGVPDTLGNNLLVLYTIGNSLGVTSIHLERIAICS